MQFWVFDEIVKVFLFLVTNNLRDLNDGSSPTVVCIIVMMTIKAGF